MGQKHFFLDNLHQKCCKLSYKLNFENDNQRLADCVLECKNPIDFFELFMIDIWELCPTHILLCVKK